ncbi:hypothetical protein SAMN05192575_104285 [Nocardioides alpinus]|uniref:Uncharacterized protein n=1 Tax=Nocardioides alpinus TaxID=748909 RepID=A0A1I0YZ57_9ACTN|nr:hypothetical protein [Nocardioides alpinus]PKH43794.1 hypothetical protein CXG46_04950 [Nocardioides alpinus]SFB17508.1 hypothetical protein SAMN05192575_104285 [Nocardioides alpinus]
MSASPAPVDLAPWPDLWRGLVDDAAIFPPGDVPVHDATAAYSARRAEPYAALVGSFVLRDTDLPLVRGFGAPLSVVVTGGAGQLAGPLGAAARLGLEVAGVEIAVRDHDDPVGNVRRIDAAARAADVDAPVFIEIPGPVTAAWLAAADEVAARGHRLKLRLGHVDHDLIPDAPTVAAWIDASLDRETPFKATAGLHRAVRHEAEGGGAHGFLNVLVATQVLWDGGSVADATDALEQRDGASLAATDLPSARRWFTSFGSCSVTEPLDDLTALGLLSAGGAEHA